jgi:hypothetical protein
MVETETQLNELNENNGSHPDDSSSGGNTLLRIFGIVLVLLAVVLGIYGTVAYLAWQSGQTQRTENARQALEDEMAEQLDYARGDVNEGNFTLALRRLEWILVQNPEYPGVVSLQLEAQAGLDKRLAPTPTPEPTVTPVAEITPLGPDPEGPFAELSRLIEDGEWGEAIVAIIAFQAQFPGHKRQETDIMLYNAYIEEGIKLLNGDRVELGLFYLTQAEKLGDLPVEAEDHRIWAELYLIGIGYFGVDWGLAVYYFRDLCAAAPFYQDACLTFHEALVAYGDQYASNLDWCPARDLYAEAVQMSSDQALQEKLRDARTACLEATPTPPAVITATITITGTPSNG